MYEPDSSGPDRDQWRAVMNKITKLRVP